MSWTKNISLIGVLAFLGAALPGMAQSAEQVKKEVEKLRAQEAKERASLEKRLNEKRAKAVAELDKLIALYERRRDEDAVDALQEQREYIIERMGDAAEDLKELAKSDDDDEPEKKEPKQAVKLNVKYAFSDDVKEIEGEFFFYENNKLKFRHFQGGKQKEEHWTWQDKGDHIFIQGDAQFGPIYISEVPKSGQNSIIVRWGGTLLKHRTSKATIK